MAEYFPAKYDRILISRFCRLKRFPTSGTKRFKVMVIIFCTFIVRNMIYKMADFQVRSIQNGKVNARESLKRFNLQHNFDRLISDDLSMLF